MRGTPDLPNRFHRPYGPGWALVGDAGLVMDPITAYGIGHAFRDAHWREVPAPMSIRCTKPSLVNCSRTR